MHFARGLFVLTVEGPVTMPPHTTGEALGPPHKLKPSLMVLKAQYNGESNHGVLPGICSSTGGGSDKNSKNILFFVVIVAISYSEHKLPFKSIILNLMWLLKRHIGRIKCYFVISFFFFNCLSVL